MHRIATALTFILLPLAAHARTTQSGCIMREPPSDSGVLLSAYTTRFKSTLKRRASNVRLAARRLDGIVLLPYAKLSYNAAVGPRTTETGFRNAPVIDQGEYKNKAGGGVCQPSSTLYAAALFAGLHVVQRRPHLWAAAYIGHGLDAAVVWRRKDLVLQNPYPFAVRIEATSGDDSLTIRLLGDAARAGWVTLSTRILHTTPYPTTHVENPKVEPGQVLVAVPGQEGAKVTRRRVFVGSRGRTTRSEALTTDVYAPRPHVVHEAPPPKTASTN